MARKKRIVLPHLTPAVRLDTLEDQMERLAQALLELERGPAQKGHQKLLHAAKTIVSRANRRRAAARRPRRAA